MARQHMRTGLIVFICCSVIGLLASPVSAEDRFSISAGNGVSLDQDMDWAHVRWALDDSWHFATRDISVRVEGFRMGDEPVAQTTEIVTNNTGISFSAVIHGVMQKIGCHATEEDEALIERTELTETRVGGRFRVVMSYCNDYFTGADFTYDQLPLIVVGTFSVDQKD